MNNKTLDDLEGFIGPPSDGKCDECGVHAQEHGLSSRVGHRWAKQGCQFDKDGRHVWSQSGDGGHAPCRNCGRRNPRFYPEDWNGEFTHDFQSQKRLDEISPEQLEAAATDCTEFNGDEVDIGVGVIYSPCNDCGIDKEVHPVKESPKDA